MILQELGNKVSLRIFGSKDLTHKEDSLLKSYVGGILDVKHGESYGKILGYFFPEFITALLLYSVVPLIDARWIASLKSTSIYATVGVTNTLIHFIIKAAEGLSVGTVILAGHYNGLQDYKEVGRSVLSSFWVTCVVGGSIASMLFFGAHWIYVAYGVPQKMIELGVPFLRLKALGLFCMFINFAFVGFLRGIKKPKIPMQLFIGGCIVFLFFDYALIYGSFGLPELGLMGSAWATVIQYAFMLIAGIAYIVIDPANRIYSISLFTHLASWRHIVSIFQLSWPIVLDKAVFAAAYIWLGYLINPMGKYAIASYSVIKDLERLAIQPAGAFAQVITFLVSNSYSVADWQGIKTNIKKTIFLASLFVFSTLLIFSIWPAFFISIFDQKGKFTAFSAGVFPFLSVLVFFDLLQLVLSGALRGAANVKVVMLARLGIFLVYFIPISWFIAGLPLENQMLKFLLIYGSFYIGNGLMSLIYVYRFRGNRWKDKAI
ncbi:MAG: MATE family efflux transporter [Candidatus Babeliales bacterium]